jgi:hypothetical protein
LLVFKTSAFNQTLPTIRCTYRVLREILKTPKI